MSSASAAPTSGDASTRDDLVVRLADGGDQDADEEDDQDGGGRRRSAAGARNARCRHGRRRGGGPGEAASACSSAAPARRSTRARSAPREPTSVAQASWSRAGLSRPTPKSQMKWRMPPSMWWISAQVKPNSTSEPDPRAEHRIGEVEGARPARRRHQPPDQQHGAEIEPDAGHPVGDRHRHGDRPAIDLQMRRKRAVRLDVGVRHAPEDPRKRLEKRRSVLAPRERRVKSGGRPCRRLRAGGRRLRHWSPGGGRC